MTGKSRLKDGGSNTLRRKDPKGGSTSKKSRGIQQKHARFT